MSLSIASLRYQHNTTIASSSLVLDISLDGWRWSYNICIWSVIIYDNFDIKYHIISKFRWRRGVVVNALLVINEVTLCRVRLVLGWVTVCDGKTISVCNQPPRSTQPGHPSVVGTISTSKSRAVNRHTTRYTSAISVVLQGKLVSGWGLRKQRSTRLGKDCTLSEVKTPSIDIDIICSDNSFHNASRTSAVKVRMEIKIQAPLKWRHCSRHMNLDPVQQHYSLFQT